MSSAFCTSFAPLRTPTLFDAWPSHSSFSYRSPDQLAYLRVLINPVTCGDDIVIFLLDYVAVSTVRSVYKLGLDTLMRKHIVSPSHTIFALSIASPPSDSAHFSSSSFSLVSPPSGLSLFDFVFVKADSPRSPVFGLNLAPRLSPVPPLVLSSSHTLLSHSLRSSHCW